MSWERALHTPDLESELTNFQGLPGVQCRNCTSAPSWRAGVSHSMRSCPADVDTLMSSGRGSYLTGSIRGVAEGNQHVYELVLKIPEKLSMPHPAPGNQLSPPNVNQEHLDSFYPSLGFNGPKSQDLYTAF